MIVEVGAPPVEIDPQYLATMKATEWGGYGRSRQNRKRNQVDNTRAADKAPTSLQAPKFLSEKARESANDNSTPSPEKKISEVADAIGAIEISNHQTEVPLMYRNVVIKYSKFGVDDFDFA